VLFSSSGVSILYLELKEGASPALEAVNRASWRWIGERKKLCEVAWWGRRIKEKKLVGGGGWFSET